jgi:serine protease
MNKYFYLLCILCGVTFTAATAQSLDSTYVTGAVFVKVKQLANPGQQKTSAAVNVARELPFLSKFSTKYSIAQADQSFYFAQTTSLRQVYRLTLKDPELVEEFIDEMKNDPSVVYAERVPLVRKHIVPNDPGLVSAQYALGAIRAYEAWNVSLGSSIIKVAICDNAVETGHPDLAGAMLPGYDVANNDNNPNPPDATMNHGTHVAGIAGAVTNNGIGMASMNLGGYIKLIPVKSTTDNGGSTAITHPYEGVLWASQNGANVINTSWGGGGFSQTYQNIANDVFARGIIWVASAGNNGTATINYPAGYQNVLSVVSTSQGDIRSSFSTYGNWVDICAPGGSIYSTVPFGGYANLSGTSMASPLAAGMIAYVWSINPNLTATQVINLVKATCDNIDAQNPGFSGLLGSGRINAYRAALQACPNPLPVSISPSGASTLCEGSTLTLTATAYSNGTYQWTKDNLLVGTNSNTLTVNETGRYGMVYTAPNGCPSSASAVNVTVSAISAMPVVPPATACGGDGPQSGTLVVTSVACPTAVVQNITLPAFLTGYDGGSSSGADPAITLSGFPAALARITVSITWEKKDGGNQTSCGVAAGTGNPFNVETQFRLRSPSGTEITLIPAGGYSSSVYGGIVTTVFADGAAAVIGSTPASGTFSPNQPLSAFTGQNPNGIWTLLPSDDGGGDPLCVSGFGLTFQSQAPSGPPVVSWWDVPTGGQVLATGMLFSPGSSTLTTRTFYAQTICAGLCPSPRTPVTLTRTEMATNVPNGDWLNATIWSCNRVPNATDAVWLNTGASTTANLPGQTASRLIFRPSSQLRLAPNRPLRLAKE